MTDTARVTATPLTQDLFPFEVLWHKAGAEKVETFNAWVSIPFGQVAGYWLTVTSDNKQTVNKTKFSLLRAALEPESFDRFCRLADQALDEAAVDEVIRLLLDRYESPPTRPSQPPRPSQRGRRTTVGGSAGKRSSKGTRGSSTTRAGAGS